MVPTHPAVAQYLCERSSSPQRPWRFDRRVKGVRTRRPHHDRGGIDREAEVGCACGEHVCGLLVRHVNGCTGRKPLSQGNQFLDELLFGLLGILHWVCHLCSRPCVPTDRTYCGISLPIFPIARVQGGRANGYVSIWVCLYSEDYIVAQLKEYKFFVGPR